VTLCTDNTPLHNAQEILLGTCDFPWEATAISSICVDPQEALKVGETVFLDRQDETCVRQIEVF